MRASVPGLLDDTGVTLLGRVIGVYALLAVANVGVLALGDICFS